MQISHHKTDWHPLAIVTYVDIWDWTLSPCHSEGKIRYLVDVWSTIWVRFQHVPWRKQWTKHVSLRKTYKKNPLPFQSSVFAHTQHLNKTVCALTDETVHVLRVARVVWDCEASVADRHLALPKRQSEVTEFIQQTAHRLCRSWNKDNALKCESSSDVLLVAAFYGL